MEAIPFVLIDNSVLTNGMRVMVAGININQFEKNPVMFYLHDDITLPIGRWANIRKENGQLLADAEFDMEDDDKEVQRIIKKVQNGYIKMASAGLVDLELSDDPTLKIEGQKDYTVTKCRIREASIVPIGRNHGAFRLYDKQGIEIELNKKESSLQLADLVINQKIEKTMSKKYLKALNLADDASDEMIEKAVEKLQGDKEAAEGRANTAEKDLNDLKLADKNEKRTAFGVEVEAAIKAGRIDEKADGSVKTSFLDLFDKSPEAAKTTLGALPKPKSLKDLELGDKDNKEFKELEAMDYGAMDKAGKALLCRDKYPDMYKDKFKAKFGTDPKA